MQEQISKVVVNDRYYDGQDYYSEGTVEDQLLEIAKNYPRDQWNQVIAEQKSWPVLYHFSEIRENIVEWLPMEKTDHVLEIGSGCGAITGALARKAGKVTCVELSKKRSMVNAYRNREYSNVEILLGNFQKIESQLTETYDYITLIGVFEYSQSYIQAEEPYVEMLKRVRRHLKPNGKLVIAIENRLGLKYWAGCAEDHNGRFFEGLEGYGQEPDVQTFSKKEIGNIIKKSGEWKTEFYYPYPDYKFPTMIFSDERLPQKGELCRNENNFDRERMVIFDETRVFDGLIESGLFPEFSNSFLLLLEVQ